MMKNIQVRDLRKDEIECRVQSATERRVQNTTEKGVFLLLYKNARADVNLMNETYGRGNWQRKYVFLNGNCFCVVSVWDDEKQQWVEMMDVGVESFSDAVKGQASDAFKRACVNWLDTSLYTAPRIWIPEDKCRIVSKKDDFGNTKYACYDQFGVQHIKIENKTITRLAIKNNTNGQIVFEWGSKPTTADRSDYIKYALDMLGRDYQPFQKWMKDKYGCETPEELKTPQWDEVLSLMSGCTK